MAHVLLRVGPAVVRVLLSLHVSGHAHARVSVRVGLGTNRPVLSGHCDSERVLPHIVETFGSVSHYAAAVKHIEIFATVSAEGVGVVNILILRLLC